jgi:hypothetical protein
VRGFLFITCFLLLVLIFFFLELVEIDGRIHVLGGIASSVSSFWKQRDASLFRHVFGNGGDPLGAFVIGEGLYVWNEPNSGFELLPDSYRISHIAVAGNGFVCVTKGN